MKVVWTPQAYQDRSEIWDFIAAESPAAAERMDRIFSEAAASLAAFPNRGRRASVAGTRELIPHDSYRLIYEVVDDAVWVLAIVHTARRWPPPHI
ncbi:MAG TPA: type II toxin-antitoxin system RelE/ParE family toxin [Phenylobacterium sp.]|uniref:type II toxin-antitoxin system RelE/ParE family toxin n=1 Tax=Phenylobacterium sp. TaxID=1871053 RepID=UPI002D54A04B|nr:type II toxin-antitoxin system RelE/ParE family toxin [Phenylobacterium sp.]HZZ67703.1 type II toxin-antitoxin system RelE/ParE family toxin [Phenylobacterium sp.]